MGQLGCDPDYRVLVADRCAGGGDGVVRAELDPLQINWSRALNKISSSVITTSPDCCDGLSEVRQGRDLLVMRNDEQVWRGEMMSDPQDCRGGVTITAFDRWAIYTRRLIHNRLCFRDKCGGAPASAFEIVKALIADGSQGDDRCAGRAVTYYGSCPSPLERDYAANSAYVNEALDDLSKSQVDYTSVGDRLIVMCKEYELGQTATLSCSDFASDVCAGSGGLQSATRVVVVGDGVFGSAGGPDPYYGLLEARVEDDSIKTEDAANQEARARLADLRPPVWWVDEPNGSQLSSDAPVEIRELVPGVLVPVQLDCVCAPLSEMMRLSDVSVTYSASEGEKVAVTMGSVHRSSDHESHGDEGDE